MTNQLRGLLASFCLGMAPAALAADGDCAGKTFPTVAVADYVLACMAANGNTYAALHQCSCSIDYIQSQMTYLEFEEAQTILQVQLDRGQRGVFYRESNWAKNKVDEFQKHQAESTLRCF